MTVLVFFSRVVPAMLAVAQWTRGLHCNRAVITHVKRETFTKNYPTMLVLPDGATIEVRYALPRQIVKLPIDEKNCSQEDLRRLRQLRRPMEKVDAVEDIATTFDPMQYLKK
jgi:large subunit ribosomal protein L55